MGPAGRRVGSFVALCSVLWVAACGEPSVDAYCEANGKGNQQTLQLLTDVLERKRNQTGLYLARARCHYFLGSYAHALQDASEVIRRLPNKADAYLIRAKAGKKLQFTLWTNAGNKTREQYVTVMQQQWKAIGVDATPKTEEWAAFLTRITESKDFEVFLVGFSWGVDADQTTMWATESYTGGFNMGKYSNSKVDDLLKQGLSELDTEKRKAIYLEMQNIIMDEVPNVILDFPQATALVNKRANNFFPNAVNIRWASHLLWVSDGK